MLCCPLISQTFLTRSEHFIIWRLVIAKRRTLLPNVMSLQASPDEEEARLRNCLKSGSDKRSGSCSDSGTDAARSDEGWLLKILCSGICVLPERF